MLKHLVHLLAVLLLAGGPSAAQSVWAPRPGGFTVTTAYNFRSFQQAWRGPRLFRFPGTFSQHTGSVNVEYGISRNWTADSTFGYTATRGDAFGRGLSDNGWTDTNFGLRYKFIDERKSERAWMPSLSLRVAGIVAGSYQSNLRWSAGDGGSGIESSLLFGKFLRRWNAGYFGDFGYRKRTHPIPEDVFASIGAFKGFGPKRFPLAISGAFRNSQGLYGTDFGNPGVSFPSFKERFQSLEAGFSISDPQGRSYQVFVAKVINGRNTGRSTVVGVSTSFSF
jgi:hypothetical protein